MSPRINSDSINKSSMVSSGMNIGRRKIYCTAKEINRGNVVEILNTLLPIHVENCLEEDYLY